MATPELRKQPISRALRLAGDPFGGRDIAVDGDPAALRFSIQPADDETFVIRRLIWSIADDGPFRPDTFGAGSALTNGLRLQVERHTDNSLFYVLDAGPIKTNGDLASIEPQLQSQQFGGTGPIKCMSVDMDFTKTYGEGANRGIVLRGAGSEALVIVVSDDLTFLTSMSVVAQGLHL